jgi:Papain family cysteine protease
MTLTNKHISRSLVPGENFVRCFGIKPLPAVGIERRVSRRYLARCVGHFFASRILLAALLAVVPLPAAHGAGVEASSTNLASAIDLRPAFRKWGLPLRLQGSRGTCSVFTMTGALEYALASSQQTGTVLSVEFLNWASNQATTNMGDGGFFADLWTGFEVYGICPEPNLPYRQNYDPELRPDEMALRSAKEAARAHLSLHWIKPWDVTTGLTETQYLEIKRILSLGWPVCGGFRWPKREHWQNNILQMAPAQEVFDGHSVLLVGFKDDPDQPGGGVFLIRNSGGGVHDGAMPYEYVRAYMNDGAWIEPASGTGP